MGSSSYVSRRPNKYRGIHALDDLVTVPERGLQFGAKPYDGPERPKLRYEK